MPPNGHMYINFRDRNGPGLNMDSLQHASSGDGFGNDLVGFMMAICFTIIISFGFRARLGSVS